MFSLAARVGDSGAVEGVLPVGVVLNSAALEVLLDEVPGGGKLGGVLVVRQALLHVLLDLGLQVSFQGEGCNTSTNLCNQDDKEEESIGVHHALALITSAAASEEGDDKDDTTQNDNKDWSIDIVITEKVKIIFGLNLCVGSKPDQDASNEGEETVADDHEVLDEACTTRLHDEENTNSGR